jgi:hypothetical protein
MIVGQADHGGLNRRYQDSGKITRQEMLACPNT